MANPRRADYADQYAAWEARFKKGKGENRSWSEGQQAAQDNAIQAVKDVVTAPFNLVQWIVDNWQAAVVIVISLLILTRG